MAVIGICSLGVTAKGNLAGFLENPAGQLVKYLEGQGHTVVDYTDSQATHFVSLDHHGIALRHISKHIPTNKRVLVVQEPLVVLPANYSKRVQRNYGAIVSLTPEVGQVALPWPQADWPEMVIEQKDKQSSSIILVNSNKSSFIPGSMYGLRRKVMRAFLSNKIQFDLAGSGWDRNGVSQIKHNLTGIAYAIINGFIPRLSEYSFPTKNNQFLRKHGIVDNKYELMAEKEFAVVIENSKTYISEKLFDAIIAGCIPLFCGPELSRFGIPEEVAVVLPDNPKAFVNAYFSLTPEEKEIIRENGKQWLASSKTILTWSQEPALERLALEISKKII